MRASLFPVKMKPGVFLRLVRIEHALLLCVAVLVGEVLVLKKLPSWDLALLSFFPPLFIEMSAFAINDFFDVEADRINKRNDRPLVSGEATMEEALVASIICAIIGVVSAWFINFTCFGIAVVFCGLAFLYSYKLKDLPLIGNTYIAFTMAIPFVFGSLAVSPYSAPQASVLMVVIAFMTGLGREVIKTVQDVEGDKARGAHTLPMVIGDQMSLLFASFLYVTAVLLSAVPFLMFDGFKGDYNYLITIGLCDALLLYTVARLQASHRDFLEEARKVSLFAVALGLLAFLLGALTG